MAPGRLEHQDRSGNTLLSTDYLQILKQYIAKIYIRVIIICGVGSKLKAGMGGGEAKVIRNNDSKKKMSAKKVGAKHPLVSPPPVPTPMMISH